MSETRTSGNEIPSARAMLRLSAAVVAVWIVAGIMLASQAVLGSNLQGDAMSAGAALSASLIQTLPWIPVTLAVIALASRFPLKRRTWRRSLPIHLLAFPVLLFIENMLVVLVYWMTSGNYGGFGSLLASARFWSLMRVHVAALVYIGIAALTQAVAYYRRNRDREIQLATMQAQLSRARLDALTAQIRPHFLFNTLHTIGHLWRAGRADEADALLDHLGTLFQRVHESTEHTFIALEDELETVQAYLAIESARFSDRLRIETRIEEGTTDCAVPPLLLQPLVENAVRHGIAVSSAAGLIRVTSRIESDRLCLRIEDDGPGANRFSPTRGSGTGLRNTRERLSRIFGSRHRFVFDSGADGTRVNIEIPAVSVTRASEWIVDHAGVA